MQKAADEAWSWRAIASGAGRAAATAHALAFDGNAPNDDGAMATLVEEAVTEATNKVMAATLMFYSKDLLPGIIELAVPAGVKQYRPPAKAPGPLIGKKVGTGAPSSLSTSPSSSSLSMSPPPPPPPRVAGPSQGPGTSPQLKAAPPALLVQPRVQVEGQAKP